MLLSAKIPEFSHMEQAAKEGVPPFFVTTDGQMGAMWRLPVIDIESTGFDQAFSLIPTLLSRLKPGVLLRVIHEVMPENQIPEENSRKDSIALNGYLKNSSVISVENTKCSDFSFLDWLRLSRGKKSKSFLVRTQEIIDGADFAVLRELGGVPLSEQEVRKFFSAFNGDVVATHSGIDTGNQIIGVLRLWRQSTARLDQETLAILREGLIPPYTISVSIRKLTDVRAQYLLQRRRGQLAASSDTLSVRTYQEADDLTAETVLAGKGLVEVEWLLTLKRRSERELREDLENCERALAPLGDVYIETVGAAASFIATLPGADPHHSFLELDETASFYLPLFSRGEGNLDITHPKRSLPLHRRDGSIYYFDLWRDCYDGANCVINGRRGKGKSVLANLISTAMLDDPDVRLIKVDVGGSYVKECELTGGRHIEFNLSEPSGLNPFSLIGKTNFPEDAAIITAGFLSTLILESCESVLSKEMLGEVERAVLSYTEKKPKYPTLSDFLSASSFFPRRHLLERFSAGGVFANVLKERGNSNPFIDGRYVYFNFERLQNAANEDFAQAVMAAVIAAVNMEVLRAGDARRGAKHKVVFFADETPFFIQRNGRFFKLTTANFRKFGHATILIAQTTKDFELPRDDGQVDHGILINSPIRFFYQVDDDPEIFAKRFGFTTKQMAEIENLGRSEQYREVFLQDELGGRVLRVAVTPEEYWKVTSSRADNERLHAVLKAVPGLTLKEAIRCLAKT
ncbi:MAG: hypothetical protein AABZ06_12890 [Bdellovibrionota bacterium]